MLTFIHGPQRDYSSIFGAEHGDRNFVICVETSRVRISRFVCGISPVSLRVADTFAALHILQKDPKLFGLCSFAFCKCEGRLKAFYGVSFGKIRGTFRRWRLGMSRSELFKSERDAR